MIKKLHIISDIDDVVRNLRDSILSHMKTFYRSEDIGEYDYKNDKIIKFFDWYETKPFFHELFMSANLNTDLIDYYKRLIIENSDMILLSSNQNKTTILKTKKQFNNERTIKLNAHFVDYSDLKIKFVLDNIDKFDYKKENIVFIDDRLDTCISFMNENIKTFWYTKYIDTKIIKKELIIHNHPIINSGGTEELKTYITNIRRLSNG